MRVILDTNVVLSALIKVDSKPYKVVQAWLDGRFELVSSAAQLEEIARVSRYSQVRRFIEPAEVGWLVIGYGIGPCSLNAYPRSMRRQIPETTFC